MDPLAEIRQLYFTTTRGSIQRDFARAVTLLKSLPTEEERERARVFMDGLAAMRTEWTGPRARPRGKRRP